MTPCPAYLGVAVLPRILPLTLGLPEELLRVGISLPQETAGFRYPSPEKATFSLKLISVPCE
jgi:hypothetical protein